MKTPYQITKILIPIDFSETSKLALEHASHLCSKFDASLHLLHILTGSYADVLPNLTATDAFSTNAVDLKANVIEELDNIGKEFNAKYGVSYNIEAREGSISKEITKTAEEVKANLIVMGTHGVSGFEEFFLGSNAYRVVTSVSIPILTVQTHSNKIGYDNIALPIDSSKHSRDKVSQAVTIALAFDATIHLAALITEEHEDEKEIFNLKIKQIEEYLKEKKVKYSQKFIHGTDIADMTMNFAKEVNADLTVVMTEQEAATGLFMGPYAQRVINHSKTPILSVTPIELIESFSQSDLGGDYKPFYL